MQVCTSADESTLFAHLHTCTLAHRYLFAYQPGHRHNHLLQGNAAVLKGIAVIIYKVIVIVGITQVTVLTGKYIR